MRTTKAKIVFTQAVSIRLRDSKSQDESYDRVVGNQEVTPKGNRRSFDSAALMTGLWDSIDS